MQASGRNLAQMFSLGEYWLRFMCWIQVRPFRRIALVLAGLLSLAYAAMPSDELTFDSSFIIGDDTRLEAFTMDSLVMIFRFDYWWPSLSSNLFRPLTTISFWFEYSFLGYGESPLGYQFTNLLLHLLNALLVFELSRLLKLTIRYAFVATVIYAVHPIATEVVTNIVGRSDLLATLATLSGLILYFRALAQTVLWDRIKCYIYIGLCALFGVMAKESAIVLPALIAWHGLLRIGELRRPETSKLWYTDAALAISAVFPSLVFFLVARSVFASQPGVSDHPFIDNPLMAQGLIESRISAMGVWGMQLHALFFPLKLSSDYSFNAIPVATLQPLNATAWWGFGTILFFIICGILIKKFAKIFPQGVFLFGAYVIAMLPTSNVILRIGSIRADRFHYLPSLFLWIGLIGVFFSLCLEINRKTSLAARSFGRPIMAVAASWILCFFCLTHLRCYDWRNNLTLWRSALENAPGSVKASAAVANETVRVLNSEASAREALERIQRTLPVYDELNVAAADRPLILYSDFGAFSTTLYDELIKIPGREAEALVYLKEGLRLMEIGLSYEASMRERWAQRWTDGKVAEAPIFETLHRNYAIGLMRSNRMEEALRELDLTLQLRPMQYSIREVRASCYRQAGRMEDAARDLMLLSVMRPESLEYLDELGEAIKKLHPESSPLIRDPQGRLRLDLADKAVRRILADSCASYYKILIRTGDFLQMARLRRTAKYIYDVPFGGSSRSGIDG